MTGFKPLPGSSAADAIEEIGSRDLTRSNISSEIDAVLRQYGVDPMTRAAASESAAKIVQNNPQTDTSPGVNIEQLAQDLVGNAVSDPRVAANKAAARVDALDASLPREEQNAKAVAIAGEEAAAAGGNRATAESKTREALAQGIPPRQAAMAGAAAAVSLALADNPNPSGLEVFGHFRAMVDGLVMETYLAEEKKDVAEESHWQVTDSFIQTTSGDLTITCKEYLATAEHDESIIVKSASAYIGGYHMYALLPFSATVASGNVAGGSTTFNWAKMSSIAPYKEIGFLGDYYIALLGTEVTDEHRANIKNKIRQAGLAILNVPKKLKFSGGSSGGGAGGTGGGGAGGGGGGSSGGGA